VAAVFAIQPFTGGVSARLVSVEESYPSGSMCEWADDPQGSRPTRLPRFPAALSGAADSGRAPARPSGAETSLPRCSAGGQRAVVAAQNEITRAPIRTLRDTYPTYTACGAEPPDQRGLSAGQQTCGPPESLTGSEHTGQCRRAGTEADARGTERRSSSITACYIDPVNGDVYAVESDVGDG
jgi:hypothetical protein